MEGTLYHVMFGSYFEIQLVEKEVKLFWTNNGKYTKTSAITYCFLHSTEQYSNVSIANFPLF